MTLDQGSFRSTERAFPLWVFVRSTAVRADHQQHPILKNSNAKVLDIRPERGIMQCMRRSSKPLPKDPNQLAYEIVKMSTEEGELARSPVSEYLSQIGRKGGLKGGRVRAQRLPATRRQAIARKAAKARWSPKS